jgi:thioredoxin-related protein
MLHKIICFCSAVCLGSFYAAAQEQTSIQFLENRDWTALFTQAKAEQKLLFVNYYASWCGSCKWMETQVFTDSAVAAFYNKNFINVQVNTEQDEGHQLAQTYAVRAYPTMLYLDGDGKLIHRAVGSKEPNRFLSIGRTAVDPERCFAALEKRLDAGERNLQFVSRLMQVFTDAMHPRTAEVVQLYLELQPDWNTPETIRLIAAHTQQTDTKAFRYMIENRTAFEREIGRQTYLNTIRKMVLKETFRQSGLPAPDALQTILQQKLPEPLATQLFLHMQLSYYLSKNDISNYSVTAVKYYNQYPSTDLQELNAVAWTFYERVDDPALLQEAVKWAKKSVDLNSYSFNNETLAALYYKLGDQANAKQTVEKAIAHAKANKENHDSASDLLKKIDTMRNK